jgi:hypothetical protein
MVYVLTVVLVFTSGVTAELEWHPMSLEECMTLQVEMREHFQTEDNVVGVTSSCDKEGQA